MLLETARLDCVEVLNGARLLVLVCRGIDVVAFVATSSKAPVLRTIT